MKDEVAAVALMTQLIGQGLLDINPDGHDHLRLPLPWALMLERPGVVRALIQAGANVNHWAVLDQALALGVDTVRMMQDAGADVHMVYTVRNGPCAVPSHCCQCLLL